MATTNIDIKVNVFSELKKLTKDLNNFYARLKKSGQHVKGVVTDIQKMNWSLKAYSKTLQQVQKQGGKNLFAGTIRGSQRLQDSIQKNTNALLSLLFLGIWLQQVMTGALRSIFEGYKKALPLGHKFNQMTNKLSANWEYFKFQLADALANSTIFQKFVGFLINVLKRLQALSPEAKVLLGVMIAVVAVLGGMFFVLAQIGLGLMGILMFTGLIQDKVNGFSWGKMLAVGLIIGTLALVITAIFALGNAISWTREKSELFDKKWSNLLDLFKKVVNIGLSPLGIELKEMGELMFWISGVAQMLATGFTIGLNALISFTKFIVTVGYSSFRTFIALLKDVANAAVAVWDAIRGEGFDRGAFANISNLKEEVKSIKKELGSIWSDWSETNQDLSNNMITFSDIKSEIQAYREEIDKTENSTSNLANAAVALHNMGLGPTASSNFRMEEFLGNVNTPKNRTKSSETVNNTIYIDGTQIQGTEFGESVAEFMNKTRREVETEIGFPN